MSIDISSGSVSSGAMEAGLLAGKKSKTSRPKLKQIWYKLQIIFVVNMKENALFLIQN